MARFTAVAVLVVAMMAALATPAGARAQVGGATYAGATEDGRYLDFTLSDDATEIVSAAAWDPNSLGPNPVTCGFGGGGIVGPWDPVPIVNGRFEITVGVDAAYHMGDATIVGEFLPDGRVRGTYRVMRVEPPPDIPEEYLWEPCDTGDMLWNGLLIPPDGPTFNGRAQGGATAEFTMTQGLGFLREFRLGYLSYEVGNCPGIASSLPVVSRNTQPVPVIGGRFEIADRWFNVADPTPAWEATITGSLLSETEAEGTIRVTVVDKPECDTGVPTWTATAPPPAPTPTAAPSPPSELPAGGTAPVPEGGGVALRMAAGLAALVAGALAAARSFRSRR